MRVFHVVTHLQLYLLLIHNQSIIQQCLIDSPPVAIPFTMAYDAVPENGFLKSDNQTPVVIILFLSGMLVVGSTSYDVHRSIKNNETPPTKEQIQAMEDYIASKRPGA
ncbi:hypothetical protein QVD17_05101 [Tagetes erecta]|uniref:Uncharacterized protein n=1 Tax=Tagetes erecta TaxID=13708 RepID=A0AAD8LKU2_TARER|nr:hypothetical protein QVD17_05101 [Tagetes erecta]